MKENNHVASDLAVSCKGIKKKFKQGNVQVEALRGVDLEIFRGELLMLMGPSGSGKTTLLSIISGILTQDEGECLIGQLNLNQMSNGDKTRYRGRHIGFVFQSFNLIPTLNCQENISVPLLLNGASPKIALNKARDLLEQVGIGEKATVYPNQLSGGQQQRVAIARAMIHNPDLIVCDEPTSYLDHEIGIKIIQLLKSIVSDHGKTIIVVTHDPRITSFADRITHLEDGRIDHVS